MGRGRPKGSKNKVKSKSTAAKSVVKPKAAKKNEGNQSSESTTTEQTAELGKKRKVQIIFVCCENHDSFLRIRNNSCFLFTGDD